MALVKVGNVSVQIPLYDMASRRLLRLPSFGRAAVGAQTVSQSGSALNIHALRNLNLELNDGDRVCVIGHNGAGKTTLLRLIAGIYPPTTGTVEIDGNVLALLSSGLTLNPDATGYENIKLFATMYDWPKANWPEYVRDIEDFTELGEYLSLPTRTYSAGMTGRLSFALVTMQPPDVLLVDEGIGAGDAQFQTRAQVRASDFIHRAKILLLASHSVELCQLLCNKALLLSNGARTFFGDINDGFSRYSATSSTNP